MKRLALLLPVATIVLSACSLLTPLPAFENVSYSLHSAGGGQKAARTLAADGTVRGSHMTETMGGPPMISISQEVAKPEDLKEIAELSRALPVEGNLSAEEAKQLSSVRIGVTYSDGTSRNFFRTSKQMFSNEKLQRLEKIMSTYRAGFW